jgi:hypothetical protein
MINNALRRLVDDVLDKGQIDDTDVAALMRDILPEGALQREDIDVLVALDRAVPVSTEFWRNWLVAVTVDFAVWASRPTGVVTREQAHWLVATLGVGEGPTDTAIRIAFEVVREAESCDEMLLTFAMRHGSAPARAASTSMLDRAALVS